MWGYVEADFRRDYGIRLCDELPRMSWREFQALLSGLSPWGAMASHYEQVAKVERLRMQDEDVGQGRGGADAFWSQVATVSRPA